MIDYNQKFNTSLKQFMFNFANIYSYRKIASTGLDVTKKDLQKEIESSYDRFPKKMKDYLKNLNMPEKVAGWQINDFVNHIDCSSLVLGHSIVDVLVFDLCEIAIAVKPAEWEHFVEDRKVGLVAVKNKNYSDLFNEMLNLWIQQFEKESLMKKADILFVQCKPYPKDFKTKCYGCARKKIIEIDKTRIEIIHRLYKDKINDCDDKLIWLQRFAFFLFTLVENHLGLKMDPSKYGEEPIKRER